MKMTTPGFNAEASLYKTSGRYHATRYGITPTTGIVAQQFRLHRTTCFEACAKCDVNSVYPNPGAAAYCKICRACTGETWEPRGGGPWAG
jgi:hypothetical protein